MLKIRVELDGEVCEIATDDVTHDTSLTSFEWYNALRRTFLGMGFCSSSIDKVLIESDE